MQALQTLKKHTIELTIITTIVCAAVLAFIALKTAPSPSLAALSILLLTVMLCQSLLYRAYLLIKRREHNFHQVGRKLVQLKAERSKEEALASKILNHINFTNYEAPDHAHVWQKPLRGISGDLALAYESPCGIKYTLLADLTGHGISAAISAAPVASIFKATARNWGGNSL